MITKILHFSLQMQQKGLLTLNSKKSVDKIVALKHLTTQKKKKLLIKLYQCKCNPRPLQSLCQYQVRNAIHADYSDKVNFQFMGGSVVEWFRVLDLKSGGPWSLLSGFILGSPEFNSSTAYLCTCTQPTGQQGVL